jgi:hypothetical protein
VTSTFEADLDDALDGATVARTELISAVQKLTDGDLERRKRGGWPIHRVLTHAIEHDYYMAMFITSVRGEQFQPGGDPTCAGQPIDEVLCRMETGRTTLLASLKGIAEDDFYTLKRIGNEEFSPLTALENAAMHDREHVDQIASILAS